jgi:hypothetical protein
MDSVVGIKFRGDFSTRKLSAQRVRNRRKKRERVDPIVTDPANVPAPQRDDPWRTRWWEWFLLPLSPLFILFLLVAAAVSVPLERVRQRRQKDSEKEFLQALTERGRTAPWHEVESELIAGRGTLIIEHQSPKGPIREWWTSDDVIAQSPVSLPTALNSGLATEQDLASIREYSRVCAKRYLDLEGGVAKLTEVPIPEARRGDSRQYVTVHLGGGLMTAIFLMTGRELATRYPPAKVVTLIAWEWLGEPILAVGDAEDVFLPPSPSDSESTEHAQ